MTSRINSESLRFFMIYKISYDEFPHFKTSVLIFLLATVRLSVLVNNLVTPIKFELAAWRSHLKHH